MWLLNLLQVVVQCKSQLKYLQYNSILFEFELKFYSKFLPAAIPPAAAPAMPMTNTTFRKVATFDE